MTLLKNNPKIETVIFSHRGRCLSKYPQAKDNSLQAFANIFFEQINNIETDLWVTKDYITVINHDPKTSVKKKKNIIESSYRDIKFCTKGMLPGKKRNMWNRKINTLRLKTIFEKFPTFKINLELKSLSEKGINETERLWLKELATFLTINGHVESVIISSFNWDLTDYIKNLIPNIKIGYLFDKEISKDDITRGKQNSIFSVNPHFSILTEKLFYIFTDNGFKTIPWTVDDTEYMRYFFKLGIYGIITDYPLLAKKILLEYNY